MDKDTSATSQSTGTQGQPSPVATEIPGSSSPTQAASSAALEIPDKFKVTRADGSNDNDASFGLALKSLKYFEKKTGSGDIPPENESGYKLDYKAFPEGVKPDPAGEKAFLKRAHGKGLSNAQVQFVIDEYAGAIKQGLEHQKTTAVKRTREILAKVRSDLKTLWAENNDVNIQAAQRGFAHVADEQEKMNLKKFGIELEDTYRIGAKALKRVGEYDGAIAEVERFQKTKWAENSDAEIAAARLAFSVLGDDDDKRDVAKVGEPGVAYKLLLKFLAKVGAGLAEDVQVGGEAASLHQTRDELMRSAAYLDGTHPDHAKVVQQVSGMYARLYER